MSDLSYPDRCVITRYTGETDEWDNLVSERIYEGNCDFQPEGRSSSDIVTHSDVVYLPGSVMVNENDRISVTTALGRKREGVVSLVRDLGLDLTGDYVTELEISQGTDK